MILENHEENVNLEGLNQLDRLEEVGLENNVLLYILKNYQTILVRDDSNKDRNIIYQTSFFTYINPLTFGEEVGKLYKNLKKAKYINCSGPTFRSIFSDTNSFGKVNWLKSQSSFQLFIQKLVAKENVICRALWVKEIGRASCRERV